MANKVVFNGLTGKFDLVSDLSTLQPLDADLTAIAALGFTAEAFLKKTAANTWALDTNTYLTSLSGALLATGATTGATSQAQTFTEGVKHVKAFAWGTATNDQVVFENTYSGGTVSNPTSWGSLVWKFSGGDYARINPVIENAGGSNATRMEFWTHNGTSCTEQGRWTKEGNFIVGVNPSYPTGTALSIIKTISNASYVFGLTIQGTYTSSGENAYAQWLQPILIPANGKGAYGFYSNCIVSPTVGTTVDAYCGYIASLTNGGAGSVATAYGMYVDTQTIGATNWTLYCNGAGNSYFGGKVGIGEPAPDYNLDVNGSFGFTPGSSVTPVDNGDVVIEATNNTTLTFKLKGSDGTVRSGTITLA